ncbi:AMP-binding protein [Streptomyces sp. NPDC002588]|uniref:AMP-binding protein n=1 Tax=Streptomyces sp. NPDC002588 TaxID=3154419 RepID=UPI003324AACF
MEFPLAGSLPAAFAAVAQSRPDTLVAFPELGLRTTVRDVYDRSCRFAAGLHAAGAGRGDVVGLLMSTGPQTLVGTVGGTATGAAVSILPVQQMVQDLESVAHRLARMIDSAGMRFLVVDGSQQRLSRLLSGLCPELTVLDWSDVDLAGEDPARKARAGEPARIDPDDTAVIQYTSGSVSRPKGVVLSHRSLLAGLRAISASAAITSDDVLIHWVPQYHDMGLFGWLATLLVGVPTHTFSPFGFIRRPAAFLRYFAEQGGTISSGPNFGYDLMIDAADGALSAELDLHRWRLAFNGAEPVSAATVSAFAERFAPAGVRPEVMYPVYGMAEATLAVAFPRPGDPPRIHHVDRGPLTSTGEIRTVARAAADAKAVVSVGRPVEGLDLRLVDAAGNETTGPTLGEIQIRGAAVTRRYHRDPEATRAAFQGEWLRTGDLGFLHDGELFVAGRSKDMVIVNGQNFFPEDIEAAVRDLPGVHRRRCVAFSMPVEDRDEHVTVLVEAKPGTTEEFAERIRVGIAREFGLSSVRVRVMPPGSLPRTTSGKWQRNAARKMIEQTI